MHAYQISIAGLIIDVIGAFLLSVEAIKPHNLRYFCDHFLRRIHHQALSPSIIVQGEEPSQPVVVNWASSHVTTFMALHYVAGTLLLGLADILTDGWLHMATISATKKVLSLQWYWVTLATLVALWFLVGGLWLLGELAHVTLVYGLRRLIALLDFIEEKYASGTVGVIGFALLFVGFMLQAVGAFLGRPGVG